MARFAKASDWARGLNGRVCPRLLCLPGVVLIEPVIGSSASSTSSAR
jgi:hypothetical protein